MAGQQKSLIGTVVSDKTEKTVTVVVEFTRKHALYHKIMKRSTRFLAHDDRFGAKPGDLVRILETRPLSRRKRWRVTEILQRGDVAEIAPREIDAEYLGQPRERQPKPEPTETPVAAAEPADTPAEEPTAETQVAPAVEEEAAVDAESTAEAPASEAAAEQPPPDAKVEEAATEDAAATEAEEEPDEASSPDEDTTDESPAEDSDDEEASEESGEEKPS